MTAITLSPDGVAVRLWRHHDPEVADLPGMDLGTDVVAGDLVGAAGDLVARGVRRVALPAPVDLVGSDDAATVRALVLVRELTSHAVVVDWRLRTGPDHQWRLLGHLYPPGEVTGPAGPAGGGVQREWASAFHLCRCLYRHGPGFVQVRDRRWGDLNRLTIDEPDYLAAIETLRAGAPATAVPAEIMADFLAEGLVEVVGGIAWWVPFRVRHWPWPAMTV